MESFLFTLIKFLHFCTEYFLQSLPTLNCDIYSLLHNMSSVLNSHVCICMHISCRCTQNPSDRMKRWPLEDIFSSLCFLFSQSEREQHSLGALFSAAPCTAAWIQLHQTKLGMGPSRRLLMQVMKHMQLLATWSQAFCSPPKTEPETALWSRGTHLLCITTATTLACFAGHAL